MQTAQRDELDRELHPQAERDSCTAETGGTEQQNLCSFYAHQEKRQVYVSVTVREGDRTKRLPRLTLTDHLDQRLSLYRPESAARDYPDQSLAWKMLKEAVFEAYRRKLRGEEIPADPEMEITFSDDTTLDVCSMDLSLPGDQHPVCGFRVKYRCADDHLIISVPRKLGRWEHPQITWRALCRLITQEYFRTVLHRDVPAEPNLHPASDSRLMRIQEAESAAFRFYPQSVLRNIEVIQPDRKIKKKSLYELAEAMSIGSRSAIGQFEINLLDWIGELEFSTSTMLVDLINAGYVTFGWREAISNEALDEILKRMYEYSLIRIAKFVSVDDRGEPIPGAGLGMDIYLTEQNGNVLMLALRSTYRQYNPLAVFYDANHVRRKLAANQWLVYFLRAYPDTIGSDYQTCRVVYRKGEDFIWARLFATVTLHDRTLIAEPLRRTEQFETESLQAWLRNKIGRFVQLFDHLDQLYCGLDQVRFPSRPIIVMIFEDDAHIRELWDLIHESLPADGRQAVWLTTDLRIFNSSCRGRRFLTEQDGEFIPVDYPAMFGEERANPAETDGDAGAEMSTS